MSESKDPKWIPAMKRTEEIRRFSNLYIRKTAKGSAYSAQEIDALFRIELSHGNLTPLTLSRNMGVSKPIVSRLIDRMAAKDLIQKDSSVDDGRSYYLRVTEKGHDVLKTAYLYYVEPLKMLEEKLGCEALKELFRLIEQANR